MKIIIISVQCSDTYKIFFYDNDKYYPQIFLGECLDKSAE